MSGAEDDVCVKRYLEGEVKAFSSLYEKYRIRTYGYFYRSCNDRDTADELFQNLWLRVLSRLERYEPKGKFRQWLLTLAHNIIVDHYRQQTTDSQADPLTITKDDANEAMEIQDRITIAVNNLPFEQRQAFYLREQMTCSVADIAEIQDCSLEAAKSRLRYAYKKLQDQLEDLV